MRIVQFAIAAVVSFASLSAQALPLYWNALQSQYKGVRITSMCQTCHTAVPKLNQFGKDFHANVLSGGGLSNQEGWTLLKMLDSDQDGVANDDELRAGKNPGKADAPAAPTPAPTPEPTPEVAPAAISEPQPDQV